MNSCLGTATVAGGVQDLAIKGSGNQLLGAIQRLLSGKERPSIMDPLTIVVYYGILFDMVLVEGVLFALNILASQE